MTGRALLTAAAAAEQLGFSDRTLRDHVKRGSLPTVTIGLGSKRPRYRFDPADLEAHVAAYMAPSSEDDHVAHLHAHFRVPVTGKAVA